MRAPALIATALTCAAAGGGAIALAASAGEGDAASAPPQRTAAYAERRQTVLPPLPAEHKAKLVEPVAGESGSTPGARREPAQAPPTGAPKPRGAASAAGDLDLAPPSTSGDGVRQATALPNGIALPPLEAPQAVRDMIDAGNVFARSISLGWRPRQVGRQRL